MPAFWSKFLQGTLERLNFAIKYQIDFYDSFITDSARHSPKNIIADVRLQDQNQAAFKIHSSHLPVPWSMSKLKHNRDCQRQGLIEAIDQQASSSLMCVIFILFDFTLRKNSTPVRHFNWNGRFLLSLSAIFSSFCFFCGVVDVFRGKCFLSWSFLLEVVIAFYVCLFAKILKSIELIVRQFSCSIARTIRS